MGQILVLLGVSATAYALFRMHRPGKRHRFATRKQGWLAVAASVAVTLVGGALTPDPTPPLGVVAAPTTTTSPSDDSTSTTADSTTTSSMVTTTTVGPTSTTTSTAPPSSTTTTPKVVVVPGLSGDPTAPLPAGAEVVTVVSITDGDTIEVGFVGGGTDTVRLIGINTPENGECFADEAADLLATLIPPGASIGMTIDTSDRDQYDRLLRYLWVGTFSVNEEMVRRGAAIARRYPPDTALADRFEDAQDAASDSGAGLWAAEACGPAAEAFLTIVQIEYDAPGNDNDNLNEEWVEVRNNGSSVAVLSGWVLKDETASHRYYFPTGFALAPGESVTIHSGCGQDFDTSLYWCNTGSAIWNNDGDTGFLLDPSGNVHDTFEY